MRELKILVTGANGQLGTALVKALRHKFGIGAVITSDLNPATDEPSYHEILDATDGERLKDMVKKYNISQIYHLAAVLSANGEKNPDMTWDINMKSLMTVLRVAVENGLEKVFFPSSIAVFGSDVQKWSTPQNSGLNPSTVYGISKVAGENWALYYHTRYGLDVRSLRYPGIIGHQSMPGGGTTDYAVDIYHKAVQGQKFECYLKPDSSLPMIYMDDAVRATIQLMEAPKSKIKTRSSYNIQAVSFTPEEIGDSIKRHYPSFEAVYRPDFRQEIAESWPSSLDDLAAQEDWGWSPKYLLDDITEDMLKHLEVNYSIKRASLNHLLV